MWESNPTIASQKNCGNRSTQIQIKGNVPTQLSKPFPIKTIIVQLSSSKESSGSEPTKASRFPFGAPLQKATITMAKTQSNTTGHKAPGKQHATYTTRKCSSIAAKGGKAIKGKMQKGAQINASNNDSDNKEDFAAKLAQAKDTTEEYTLKKTRNIKLAQQKDPVFASLLKEVNQANSKYYI